MVKKTLGGDRLGAGKKMQVELHGYERSTHDLSYLWRSSMSSGTLVPFMSEIALPGDTFDINLDCDIQTQPTVGPLFGSYKVQLDVFCVPIRLYNSLMHNNTLEIGLNMSRVKLPQLELTAKPVATADIDNAQVNPSCILSYLGIRGIGKVIGENAKRRFNAVPLLAYWDIYKNYYANKQEKKGAYIHASTIDPTKESLTGVNVITINPVPSGSFALTRGSSSNLPRHIPAWSRFTFDFDESKGIPDLSRIIIVTIGGFETPLSELLQGNWRIVPGTPSKIVGTLSTGYDITATDWKIADPLTSATEIEPRVDTFLLENIDIMRKEILKWDLETSPFILGQSGVPQIQIAPYSFLWEGTVGEDWILYSQEGLGLKTYQSDLLNNWLETEYMDYISNVSAVSTAGDSFTIDQLNLSRKVYDMLNRIAVSGGTYNDWIDAVYAVESMRRAESPIYMGGLIKELVFQEVVSTAETGGQPLGTLAGKGILSKKHKGGSIYIKVDEPSYIMGIVSLTPRIDYSQGNKWDVHLQTMDDLHKPALDQIGFQDLITEQMAWWETEWDGTESKWIQKSAGKQPAWVNYMTNINRTYGNFAIENNEMFMTLNRRYEYSGQGIQDLTTYIDPAKYNFIFAETKLDAQNFRVQIACNVTARRKMSAKIMPNL